MSNVQSVERAFTLLQNIAQHPKGIGVTELSSNSGLAKSTVSRLLRTLEHLGAVERQHHPEGFVIGKAVVALAAAVPFQRQLKAIARPFLQELADTTKETVYLSLRDSSHALFVDQIDSEQQVQLQNWIGYRIPLHVSSSGKLFLAFARETIREALLDSPLAEYTEHSITESSELQQELEGIRLKHCSWALGEYDEDMTSLAAPVFDSNNAIIAAISIAGPSYRFPPKNVEPKETIEQLETLLLTVVGKLNDRLQLEASQVIS